MRRIHVLCVLALAAALALAACSEGDTVTAPATPVCGDGQCHLGETVLTCAADCQAVTPTTPITPSFDANHIKGTFSVQVTVSASPQSAIGATTFRRTRGNVLEGTVVVEGFQHTWDLTSATPSPCDTFTFSATVEPDQGYRVSVQPPDKTVTIPAALCAA